MEDEASLSISAGEGNALKQFSMDENQKYLRSSASTGRLFI